MSEITISLGEILWICAAIATISGTATIIYTKFIAPKIKLKRKVFDIETRQNKLDDKQGKAFELIDGLRQSIDNMREDSKIADRLIVRAMVEIVDNRITGNNIENLKSTKGDLMMFLQEN